MDKQKIYFETKRLIARAWLLEDIPSIVDGMNSKNVSRGFGTKYPYEAEDAESYVLKTRNEDKAGSVYYAIVHKKKNIVIGGGGVYQKEGKYYIGIWINEKMQGHGYADETITGVIGYIFNQLHAVEIYANCYQWNNGSQRIMKKNNFRIIERKQVDINGKKIFKLKGLLKKEWWECTS